MVPVADVAEHCRAADTDVPPVERLRRSDGLKVLVTDCATVHSPFEALVEKVAEDTPTGTIILAHR